MVEFTSTQEAKEALLERDIKEGNVEYLFELIDVDVSRLASKHGIEDDVDEEELSKWLKISYCEAAVELIDSDLWTLREFQETLGDMRYNGNLSPLEYAASRAVARSDVLATFYDAMVTLDIEKMRD